MPASHGRLNECWLTECRLFPVSLTQTFLFTRSHAPSARHFLECHLQTGSLYSPVWLGQHWLMLASTLKASVSGRCVILWPYLRRTDARKPNPTPTMWLRNGREEDGCVYRSWLPLELLEGKNGTGDCVPAGAPVSSPALPRAVVNGSDTCWRRDAHGHSVPAPCTVACTGLPDGPFDHIN